MKLTKAKRNNSKLKPWYCDVCGAIYDLQEDAEMCPCLLSPDPGHYSNARYCSTCKQWWYYQDYENHIKDGICTLHLNLKPNDKLASIQKNESLCSSNDCITIPYRRAGGEVLCPYCGKKYYDHPMDELVLSAIDKKPFLNVLCNGDRVKL